MTGISASFDHHNRHSGAFHPVKREICQNGTDAAPLTIRINGNHVDFAQITRRMKFYRDKANRFSVFYCYPNVRVLFSAYLLDSFLLTAKQAPTREATNE